MSEHIGKWCNFPKEKPRFEGKIINVVRQTPLVYQIEVNGIPMFKAAGEVNIINKGHSLGLHI